MHFKDFSHRAFWGRGITKTFWRAMKLTGILMLIALLHVSAAGFSQKVTISLKDAPLQKVFDEIKKQTGLSFLWDERDLSHTSTVTLNVKDATIADVLEDCLKNQGLSYRMVQNMVVIEKSEVVAGTVVSPPPIDVHGRVTDSLGNPLGGASVTVKGSKRGTSTDANGDFVLHSLNENATLIISFTSYDTKILKLNGADSYTISLLRSNSPLDQVQIIAYGTTTQRMSTGDVGTVSSQVIEQQPVVNALGALEGRVPGLNIQQTTGNFGAGYFITIRGLNSLTSGTAPLYIIDGVPYQQDDVYGYGLNTAFNFNVDITNPLNFLNPLDIESISILKDADATAIYGSQGANGVVLVTTKKGKNGKTKVDLNVYTGVSQVGHFMDLMNTQQYVAMRHEAFNNDGITPTMSNAPDLLIWDTTKYTNWQKKMIGGNANITNAQLSFSGGSANTSFLLSGNYNKQTTVYGFDFSDSRGSVNANFNHSSLDQKLKISFTANYMSDNSKLPGGDLSFPSLTQSPNTPDLIDKNGNLIWLQYVSRNPYSNILKNYLTSSNSLISSANISYQIIPGLTALINLGYNSTLVNEIYTTPITANNPAFGITTGSSQFDENSVKGWIAEPQIKWNHKYGLSKVDVLLGGTFQQTLRQGTWLEADGYTSDELLQSLASAGTVTPIQSVYTKYRYDAIFGRISYDFDSKYLVNITGRRDGSSRFGPGKQFSNFGAIGAGWIFSNEDFIKNSLHFLSFGKLRGSYGISGNDQIPDYGYLSLWSSTQYPYQSTPGLNPTNLSNPDYSWERNQKLEFGIELGFIKDRILTGVSWYLNKSSNQLLAYAVPPSTGFSNVEANLPALIENKGLEISLTTTNIKSKYFQWSSTFNFSEPTNKLVSYPNFQSSPYVNRWVIGYPILTSKYLHYTGVDPSTGILTFKDYDGNGSQTDIPGDQQYIKTRGQKYFGGFDNSFTYKGFQLDIFFQFVNQQLPATLNSNDFGVPGSRHNQPVQKLNRWQKPGQQAESEKFTTGAGAGSSDFLAWLYGSEYADYTITDASFIRLKNVALSYMLPTDLLHKIKLSSLKIYVQGQNLLTITKYIGLDPENPGLLPPLRTVTAGIKLSL